MKEKYLKLYKKFYEIRKLGWIESKRNGSTGIGYTFENLLNIEENSLPVGDFENIEIKTMRILSRKVIHLFTAAPDGDFLYPTERILDKLGYPCKRNKEYKVFLSSTSGDSYTNIGYSKKFKLQINRDEKKIDLLAKDNKNNDITLDVSWSFDLIEKKLEQKIKYLAIIKAKKKKENNTEFFHYVTIDFYELKSFERFLELIQLGYIKVTFKINVFLDGEKKGKIDNHGTDFSIKEENIDMLYEKVNIFRK